MRFIFLIFIFHNLLFSANTEELEIELNKYYESQKIDEIYFKVSANLAREYRFSNRERALRILDSAKIHVEDFLPNNFAGDIFNVYGNLYFDTGEISLALENYYICLSNAIETEDWGAASFSYSDIGYCFYNLNFYEIATYYYHKSYDLSFKDVPENRDYPMSHAALSLALSFGHLGQLDSAYYYLDIAENIRKNDPDKSKLAQVYSYKAMITFRHGNDYKSAKEIFQKAIETVKLAGDDYSWNEGLGYVYNFLGMIDASVGNLEDAKKSNAEAKKRFQEKLKYRIPYVDAQRAQIVSMEGYQDSAIVIALEALKQAEQYGIDESIIQIHEIIVSIYERNKSYERANYHIRRLNEMRDSIGSSDHISALNSVETTLKLQEKEKEKEFLKSITLILVIGIVLVLILAIYIIILIRARAKIQQNSLLKIEEKNKELEEANFTKDKFFAIIAHDLKNPFSGFKASLELLIKEYDHLDEEDRKDILGELFEMSENVNNLLINLLTWSRSQRGGIQLNLEESNLCLLLESVKNIVNQTAKDKKIKIEVDCEVDKILIDPALMNIVLLNLTTNAVKFTPEGGEVRLIGKENENELKIIVQDNGLGISKENLDKLFNLETSFTTRGTKNEAGTGLGLIICYDFVQLHGGEISVESELNIGTKFTITLQK